MEDRNTVAFKLIQDFVDLSAIVLKSHRSVALWNRLVNKADDNINANTKERCLKAFTIFCRKYKQTINSDEFEFDRDAVVRFSDRISINVRVLIHRAEDDDIKDIRDILLRLNAILTRDDQSLMLLEDQSQEDGEGASLADKLKGLNLEFDTSEGQFLGNILQKVGDVIEDGDIAENPQQGIMKLMTSGLLQDVTEGAKGKIESGELSISKMLGALQNIATQFEGNLRENGEAPLNLKGPMSEEALRATTRDPDELMKAAAGIASALENKNGEVQVEEVVEAVVNNSLRSLPTIEECNEIEVEEEVEIEV